MGNPLNYGGYAKSVMGGGGGFEGAKLTKFPNFRTFLNWYFICYKIFALFTNGTIIVLFLSYFAQIGITVFKATFCIITFWCQKGATFLGNLTTLNPLGGYKKSAIGGLSFRGV